MCAVRLPLVFEQKILFFDISAYVRSRPESILTGDNYGRGLQ